ncbi:hypothetical protein AAZX31_03G024000 [Glycine max]|nr:hypothetical protein JHK85_006325 [Glycine max]KAG5070945.1 hypothetical protein JHK86_006156 [Glycine max]KAH1068374.1 hypothetical protein GYH30_006074 [Glycine max]
MGHKKVLALIMFVMAYGLATTTFTTVSQHLPAKCNGYEPLIDTCKPDLTAPGSGVHPTLECCVLANYAFTIAMQNNGRGVGNMCDCLQFATKTLHYDPYKIIGLPGACNIKTDIPIAICIFWPNDESSDN